MPFVRHWQISSQTRIEIKISATSITTSEIYAGIIAICATIGTASSVTTAIHKEAASDWRGLFYFWRDSDADGAFENLYGGAADARHEFFAGLRYFHFDMAGPAHFHALLDVKGLRAG